MSITSYASGASAFTRAEYISPRTHIEPASSELAAGPIRTWADVIDELLALRGLEDDWDGQGARSPDPALVDTALGVALKFRAADMPPAERVIAGVNGTVFFEWYLPTKYQEIEFTAPGQAEGRWVHKESNTVEEFNLPR